MAGVKWPPPHTHTHTPNAFHLSVIIMVSSFKCPIFFWAWADSHQTGECQEVAAAAATVPLQSRPDCTSLPEALRVDLAECWPGHTLVFFRLKSAVITSCHSRFYSLETFTHITFHTCQRSVDASTGMSSVWLWASGITLFSMWNTVFMDYPMTILVPLIHIFHSSSWCYADKYQIRSI